MILRALQIAIVPFAAMQIRRLHDIGKSGWFFLVSFIPLIGVVWLAILSCQGSKAIDNPYLRA